MGKSWQGNDDQIIESYYYEEGPEGCQVRLPHRTTKAIRNQASKLKIKVKEGFRAEDLTKRIFNGWEILKRGPDYISPKGYHQTQWWSKCKCGKIVLIQGNKLRGGQKSCGHCNDLVMGKIYNKWVEPVEYVENYVSPLGKQARQVKCICHYGAEGCLGEFVTPVDHIKDGHTTSCGCRQREIARKMATKLEGTHLSSLTMQYRKSTEYHRLQDRCFERDNYCCIIKGKIPRKECQLHHKIPRRIPWKEKNLKTWQDVLDCKELWDLDNMVTISEEWHLGIKIDNPLALHKLYPGSLYIEKDFESWVDKYGIR